MQSFSQRMGFAPVREALQTESVDQKLRVALWNRLYQIFYRWDGVVDRESNSSQIATSVWTDLLHQPVDDMPKHWDYIRSAFKTYALSGEWFAIYDFAEFTLHTALYTAEVWEEDYVIEIFVEFNEILKSHKSGYRFVRYQLARIVSEIEIEAIEEAASRLDAFRMSSAHIVRSLELLSDRNQPDYRNSIKESISAVESVCTQISGKSKVSLGEALRSFDRPGGVPLNPALRKALEGLYGYSSGGGGIRHALIEESDLGEEDARFMLVACSGFVNYLIAKASQTEP